MNKIKNITIISLIIITLLNLFLPIANAVNIEVGDKSDLVYEKELPGLLQIKSNNALRDVIKVYYKSGNNKLPAFCVEPSKPGIGTGSGNSYEGTISKVVSDQAIWRVIYGGYFGKKWNETTVECDDDWYMVTKVAVQCIVNGTSPKSVFCEPDHITASDQQDGLTLADTKRRGKKVLDECEKLYNYAKTSSDNYVTAKINLEKTGSIYESGSYMVQNYTLTANKEISSYDVSLRDFPTGTLYEKADGNVVKVKIPKDSINQDYTGIVFITNAKVKTYPVFYCEAKSKDNQDYVIVADPYEIASTRTTQSVDSHKSVLNVVKSDKEDGQKIAGVVFNVRYADGNRESLGNYTTDSNGKITIEELRPGKLVLTEVSTNSNYILDETPTEITINFNSEQDIEITNEHKKGDLTVYKVDKDNNKIALAGVEFNLFSDEYQRVIGTYTTNENGEFTVRNLRTGSYKLIETKTNKWYNLAEDTEIQIEWNNVTETTIENELKKSQIRVIKVDKENHETRLANVKFNVLDEENNVLETIVTNSEGEAVTQKYAVRDYPKLYIQEIETNEKYVLDDTIREITLQENQIVDYQFENQKIKGQIEVTKVDKNDNSKPLEGAVFGVYDKNDKLIEKITTDAEGKAITSLLEKDIYTIKELETGSVYYLLNEETYTAEIVYHKQIVKLTIENEPVDIEVDVEKEGTVETKPNEQVEYVFKNIANTSNIFLDSFKWYDYLPTDYIKLETIETGTWNQDIEYDIYVKTNKSDDYILFKEDLDSKVNYKFDMEDKFVKDEYVTEFYFDFGKVEVGFKEETSPKLICIANDNLKNNDKFTNKTMTIGTYYDLIAKAEDTWTTVVHVPEKEHEPTLPKTGK